MFGDQALMRAALADPLNQKFVLMSESGIPLYPPTAMWSALMSERLSRINVCNGFRVRARSLRLEAAFQRAEVGQHAHGARGLARRSTGACTGCLKSGRRRASTRL